MFEKLVKGYEEVYKCTKGLKEKQRGRKKGKGDKFLKWSLKWA